MAPVLVCGRAPATPCAQRVKIPELSQAGMCPKTLSRVPHKKNIVWALKGTRGVPHPERGTSRSQA